MPTTLLPDTPPIFRPSYDFDTYCPIQVCKIIHRVLNGQFTDNFRSNIVSRKLNTFFNLTAFRACHSIPTYLLIQVYNKTDSFKLKQRAHFHACNAFKFHWSAICQFRFVRIRILAKISLCHVTTYIHACILFLCWQPFFIVIPYDSFQAWEDRKILKKSLKIDEFVHRIRGLLT